MILRESTIIKVDEGLRGLIRILNNLVVDVGLYWVIHEAICMSVYDSTPQFFHDELEDEIRKTLRARSSDS
jgi:hypothetical protein